MGAAFSGDTGPDYDNLLDAIAATCAVGDTMAIAELCARDELRVPAELIR
ncbi:hypothetical protein [Nocardia terpenica]|uniref:Uncharacterized protein n=1 Tax=Nocardia terpenica TaxID=455432 RepID=A0A6G9Z4T2_9NOCA|nr:hypothetical protein [Nocardia terpenica]QIS20357.1 hypothetical protein F6W96_20720 [Nocardia terpenica]